MHLSEETSIQHSGRLHQWELFVMSHELVHLFCGHLHDADAWATKPEFGMLESFDPSRDHTFEHEADIAGYCIYRQATIARESTNINQNAEGLFLAPVVGLFDVLFLLGGNVASDSHPDALTRGLTLTNAVYGNETAQSLAESYQEQQQVEVLLNTLPKPEVDIEEIVNSYRSAWLERTNFTQKA